jgi:predicted nucleic acid-binding protein
VSIDSEIERLAMRAQGELAAVGRHRLPPTDIVIAACAHRTGHAVLHYDRDYDVIAAHATLEYESDWVAPPGSLA